MRKKVTTLHEMAVRLCEGGAVQINGLVVKAKKYNRYSDPCSICDMDCLCHGIMADLCSECDSYDGYKHLLYLPYR